MKKCDKNKVLPVIRAALKEDIGRGDITTNCLFLKDKKVNAAIVVKQKGVVAGLDVAALTFKALDSRIVFKPLASDGEEVLPAAVLAYVRGSGRSILAAERTALNFLGRLSGIATTTKSFVKKIIPYAAKIMDTRKTTPNLRLLEKYAVRLGGGYNHRLGLYDQMLVKENHLFLYRFSHTVHCKEIWKEIIEKIRKKNPEKTKIEVEVSNLGEFKEALKAGPDIIMLDNFNLKNIKKAVELREDSNAQQKKRSLRPLLEASGGVTLRNVRHIARCGVDRISIGCLTHSAKSLDISLKIYG